MPIMTCAGSRRRSRYPVRPCDAGRGAHPDPRRQRSASAPKSGILTVTRATMCWNSTCRRRRLTEVDEPGTLRGAGPDALGQSGIARPGQRQRDRSGRERSRGAGRVARFRGAQDHPSDGDRHRARATSRTSRAACSCPYAGIDEDPVTGSAHGALVPFWAERLGRERFTALQASKRTRHPALPAWRRPRDPRRPLRHGDRRNFPALSEPQAPPAPHRRRRGADACLQRRRSARRSSRFPRRWLRISGPSAPWLFPLVGLASLLIAIPFSRSVAAFPDSGGPATYGRVFGGARGL